MRKLNIAVGYLAVSCCCWSQSPPASPGWVAIPIRDYEALRGRAYPPELDSTAGNNEVTLSRVEYDLRINGAVASGRVTLIVDVLQDGWVRVPMPEGLLVREARAGGQLVSLIPSGRPGQLSAVLSKKGRTTLELDVVFAVTTSGGEQRLSLPAGTAGVTRASVNMAGPNLSAQGVPLEPLQDLDVKVGGGFVTEKTPVRWLAYGRGGEPLTFTWRKKLDEPRVALPLRTRGTMTQLFGLGEDSSTLHAEVEIQVVQGAAQQVKLAVPEGLVINQVPGATVADWDLKDGVLLVNLLEATEGLVRFAVDGETRLPRGGALHIPLMRLLDVEREAGGVAVEVLGAGEIRDTKAVGLEAAEASDLGVMVASRQSPALSGFLVRNGAAVRSLDLQVARYTQQAVLTANVEEARYRVLLTPDGKTLIQAKYAVRNNQRNFVRLGLPAGAIVWSSSVGGQPVRPGQAADGSLLFPLSKGRAGEEAALSAIDVLFLVPGTQWAPRGRVGVALPALDLPVSKTGLVVYYSPLFRVTPEPGAFRAQLYESPESELLGPRANFANASNAAPAANVAANASTQALVDRYRARPQGRRAASAVPAQVAFPAVGPSLFFVSQLTEESKGGLLELNYQAQKPNSKAGVK